MASCKLLIDVVSNVAPEGVEHQRSLHTRVAVSLLCHTESIGVIAGSSSIHPLEVRGQLHRRGNVMLSGTVFRLKMKKCDAICVHLLCSTSTPAVQSSNTALLLQFFFLFSIAWCKYLHFFFGTHRLNRIVSWHVEEN